MKFKRCWEVSGVANSLYCLKVQRY